MTFHLVYHYTLPLHLNHLVFLHTYLLGVLVCISSGGVWSAVWAAAATYAAYAVLLARWAALPYAAVVAGPSAPF